MNLSDTNLVGHYSRMVMRNDTRSSRKGLPSKRLAKDVTQHRETLASNFVSQQIMISMKRRKKL
jgi:hypothetical protein